jgi:hypothetical protein
MTPRPDTRFDRERYERGRTLYHLWCGSSTTDRALYFDSMNPGDKDHWCDLADEVDRRVRAAYDVGREDAGSALTATHREQSGENPT